VLGEQQWTYLEGDERRRHWSDDNGDQQGSSHRRDHLFEVM
jgi:hypothetical protein